MIQCHLFAIYAYFINLWQLVLVSDVTYAFRVTSSKFILLSWNWIFFFQSVLFLTRRITYLSYWPKYKLSVFVHTSMSRNSYRICQNIRIIPILQLFIINNQQLSVFINYHETRRYFSLVNLSIKWIKCNISTPTAVSVTISRISQLSCKKKASCVSLFFKWDKNEQMTINRKFRPCVSITPVYYRNSFFLL